MDLRHSLQELLQKHANTDKAKILQRFFKTGPGEYAEGDLFLGITVPIQRKLAKNFYHMPLAEISILLQSEIHEERFVALLLLIHQYEKSSILEKTTLVNFYLANISRINNWDLVDISAPKILGHHCLHGNRKILRKLAKSPHWWERRIGILATFPMIKNGDTAFPLAIIGQLLDDPHDLIHKANGWMLREIGKISLPTLEHFLNTRKKTIPRTTLRYAIERMSPKKRQYFLAL